MGLFQHIHIISITLYHVWWWSLNPHARHTFTFTFTFTLIYFKQAKPTWVNLSPWPLIKAKQRNDKSHAPPRRLMTRSMPCQPMVEPLSVTISETWKIVSKLKSKDCLSCNHWTRSRSRSRSRFLYSSSQSLGTTATWFGSRQRNCTS